METRTQETEKVEDLYLSSFVLAGNRAMHNGIGLCAHHKKVIDSTSVIRQKNRLFWFEEIFESKDCTAILIFILVPLFLQVLLLSKYQAITNESSGNRHL